jgi:cell division protein FtsL
MAKGSTKKKASPTPGRKNIGIWIMVMFCFIGELFFYTWCRVQAVKVGYEISQANENRQSLLKRQKNLKIELARLKSPERLNRLAKQLRLETPTSKQMVDIR